MIRFLHRPSYIVGGKNVFLVGETVEGERQVDAPVLPYGFVSAETAIDYLEMSFEQVDLREPIRGKKVYRFETRAPVDVGKFGQKLWNKGRMSYETDIPYIRRLLIDKEIGIDYRGVCYVDVELDDSGGWRSAGEMPFLSMAYDVGDGVEFVYGDLDEALQALCDAVEAKKIYVICGWNIDFDVKHLTALAKRLRGKHELRGRFFSWLRFAEQIDMRELYKFYVHGLGSYSLDSVAEHEGFGSKTLGRRVSSLTLDELRSYNIRDVELLHSIEKKYRFVERVIRMAKELNMSISDIMTGETVVWDILILRRLRELGYVAPRKVYGQKKSYEGAAIFEPRPGLHRNVALFDFSSLYPSIVIRDRVDVFNFRGEVVPFLMARFKQLKDECDAVGDKIGRELYKVLLNSCYGMFGYQGSRYFDEAKAAHVTAMGRKALTELRRYLESLGVEVYYGDTDSVFVQANGFGDVKVLETLVNERFAPLQIKYDKHFDSILFLGRGGQGIKKRYAGLTVDGKLVVKGLEVVRGDWCRLTKRVMHVLLREILIGKDITYILGLLEKYRSEMKTTPKTDYIITRVLKEDLGSYKSKPFWVRLWEQAVQSGKLPKESREISYVMYVDGPGLVDEDRVIDYRWYWERQVRPPIDRILEALRVEKVEKLTSYA